MVELAILGGLVIVAILVLSAVMKVVAIAITIGSWILAGYLAGQIVRGKGYGPIGDAGLGLAGGIVGTIILRLIGLGSLGNVWLVGGILVGAVGAVILIYAVRMFGKEGFAK